MIYMSGYPDFSDSEGRKVLTSMEELSSDDEEFFNSKKEKLIEMRKVDISYNAI